MPEEDPDSGFEMRFKFSRRSFDIHDAMTIFDEKQEGIDESFRFWQSLNDVHKEAYKWIAQKACAGLHDDVMEWLPFCLSLSEDGDAIEITVTLVYSDVTSILEQGETILAIDIENALSELTGKKKKLTLEETIEKYEAEIMSGRTMFSLGEVEELLARIKDK